MIDPGPKPHVGGPVLPACFPTVLIGGQPAARVSDKLTCMGPPDTIVKGSFVVPIGRKPAARMTDTTAHGGVIVAGCPTVLIGLAGTTGNPPVAADIFGKMVDGRQPASGSTDVYGNALVPKTIQQSYNNCGVESSRQIIMQATGNAIQQEALLGQATSNKWASEPAIGSVQGGVIVTANNRSYLSGGTSPTTRVEILKANGVPAKTMPATMSNMESSLSEGKGVIAAVDAAYLWPPGSAPAGSFHAVVVTGATYDENGTLTNVVINDTGTGQSAEPIPAAQFEKALAKRGGAPHVVTENPIW
ncbi:MAG: PAAR domain-containing protein [Nibricoccus sp.]